MSIPQIKKILYATDLSENARHAFNYAAGLANRYDAKIVLLHVLEDFSPSVNMQLVTMFGEQKWRDLQADREKETKETIRKRLDDFCEEVRSEMSNCPFIVGEVLVKLGESVNTILKTAESSGCDLIVMGTHGQGGIAGAVLGSTARRVVRRSQIPVLVIRLPRS
jgi:nucleotide-binding universal stress UspA family protein